MPKTRYIWDPETDALVMETDGDGNTTAVYTQEPQPYGGLISQRRGGVTSYYQQDALGSTRQLTNDSEAVTDAYTYSAYGETVAASGATVNPFRWIGSVGYYFDTETGNYYVRARNYAPHIGRWVSPDPLLFIDGINVFTAYFVPHMHDPSGTYKDNDNNFKIPVGRDKDCMKSFPKPKGDDLPDDFAERFADCITDKNNKKLKDVLDCVRKAMGDNLTAGGKQFVMKFMCCILNSPLSFGDPCKWGNSQSTEKPFNEPHNFRFPRPNWPPSKFCPECCEFQVCIKAWELIPGFGVESIKDLIDETFEAEACKGSCIGVCGE